MDAFMYFVPLTSPTSIVIATQSNNTLRAKVTSWKTEQADGKAYVECDFTISGDGSYCAFYDPNEMIQDCSHENGPEASEYPELLEWIRLSGSCLGHIRAVGKVAGNSVKMERIEVRFNYRGTQSPVEVSIYDVPRVDGEFLYANRRNCRIARINSLQFKQCSNGLPRMSVQLASIRKAHRRDGFLSGLTAMIANLLSTTTPVSTIGNATMMEFAKALYEKEQAFTFPQARNFKIQL
ncbi:MAG: hypothetical protein LLF76_12730 [Planctomycetaceae bacterium]|nr:hypothetical protein [Planctomycetaceae bacterium]